MIGFGTGRCGTKSLAAILDACHGARVLHERWVPNWYKPKSVYSRKIIKFLSRRAHLGRLGGIVSFALLPRAEKYREQISDLKMVCLHRPKEETVDSWMRWCEGVSRTKPHPFTGLRSREVNSSFGKFPTIDAFDVRQSWEFYWEFYEKWAYSIEGVHHMSMYDLNNQQKVMELFAYLEIPEEYRVFVKNTHRHKGPTDVQ